jgi:hypothetical protein
MKYKSQLVCQHLENISRDALEKYQNIIREYVKGRHGVYALYKKGKLYYVGLASNLRSRLKHHLSDRHAESWDRFSIYFTISDDHMKELETLVLRISSPKGNIIAGTFMRSQDLKNEFRKKIAAYQKRELFDIFDVIPFKLNPQEEVGKKSIKGRKPTLSPFIKKRIHIRFKYKGKLYVAHAQRNGFIKFAGETTDKVKLIKLRGKVFTSPSIAASAITGRPMNGWKVWKYQRSPGEWVLINELRK